MSISSEITRISNAKTAISESIANKGVTVPSGTKIDGMATLIDSIQTGGAAVQPSKALTVTSNGTTTITPDAPYDAIKQVDLTVNVSGGGGGGAGFSVTFPATATNWNAVSPRAAHILLADGTFKSVVDYSTIGGKTIENVAGIWIRSLSYIDVLRMTLSAGGIAQIITRGKSADITSYAVTTAPNSTKTPYNEGENLFWWPVADTVISSIEMYNTD